MVEKISPEIQEYMETICKLRKNGTPVGVNEIAAYLKIVPSTVTAVVNRLVRGGYVTYSPEGVMPTDAGLKLGLKMNRKHRLLESFLYNVLKIGKDRVHGEACEMEHSLSDNAEAALCRFVGHPDTCPDDCQPIPPCDLPFASCEDCMKSRVDGLEQVGKRKENLVAVADLKEHDEGRVVFVRGDSKVLRRLLDMGITTGTPLHIIKSAPFGGPVEVAVRGSKLALGRDIAADVFVEAIKAGKGGKINEKTA